MRAGKKVVDQKILGPPRGPSFPLAALPPPSLLDGILCADFSQVVASLQAPWPVLAEHFEDRIFLEPTLQVAQNDPNLAENE